MNRRVFRKNAYRCAYKECNEAPRKSIRRVSHNNLRTLELSAGAKPLTRPRNTRRLFLLTDATKLYLILIIIR